MSQDRPPSGSSPAGSRAEPPTIKVVQPRPAALRPPDPVPEASRPAGDDASINRKLIRPRLAHHASTPGRAVVRRRPAPPVVEGAEPVVLARQVRLMTPVVVTLENGEVLRGTLEWYDRDSLMLQRAGGAGILVMKHAIVHTCRDEGIASPPAPRGRRA